MKINSNFFQAAGLCDIEEIVMAAVASFILPLFYRLHPNAHARGVWVCLFTILDESAGWFFASKPCIKIRSFGNTEEEEECVKSGY